MKIRKSDLERFLVDLDEIHTNVLKLPHEQYQSTASLAIGGHICMVKDHVKKLLGIEDTRKKMSKRDSF